MSKLSNFAKSGFSVAASIRNFPARKEIFILSGDLRRTYANNPSFVPIGVDGCRFQISDKICKTYKEVFFSMIAKKPAILFPPSEDLIKEGAQFLSSSLSVIEKDNLMFTMEDFRKKSLLYLIISNSIPELTANEVASFSLDSIKPSIDSGCSEKHLLRVMQNIPNYYFLTHLMYLAGYNPYKPMGDKHKLTLQMSILSSEGNQEAHRDGVFAVRDVDVVSLSAIESNPNIRTFVISALEIINNLDPEDVDILSQKIFFANPFRDCYIKEDPKESDLYRVIDQDSQNSPIIRHDGGDYSGKTIPVVNVFDPEEKYRQRAMQALQNLSYVASKLAVRSSNFVLQKGENVIFDNDGLHGRFLSQNLSPSPDVAGVSASGRLVVRNLFEQISKSKEDNLR